MTASKYIISIHLALFLVFLFLPDNVSARPEFARLTVQACGYCHVSPLGGGPLSPDGLAFKKNLDNMDDSINPSLRLSTGQKFLHILLWLIHIPFGVSWIVLFILAFLPSLKKSGFAVPPGSYISRMIASAAVTIVTGVGNVYMKHLGTPGLFGTRFGILLLVKITGVLALLVATFVLVWHTTVSLKKRYRKLASTLDTTGELEISTEDLRLFDGSEKRIGLVAVAGKLYSVTGRDLWRKGIHPGGHRAGTDLTRALAKAPHGKEVFERIFPAGNLLEKQIQTHTEPRWAVLMGTASAFVILLVVVLWRWL